MFSNPWFIFGVVITAIVLFAGSLKFAYDKGVEIERGICNAAKSETINENITILEKQNAIIRPDDAAYINSLRDRTY